MKNCNNGDFEKSFEQFEREYRASSRASGIPMDIYSSCNSSSVRASAARKIADGGKKLAYTLATAAMLTQNFTQTAYAYTTPVSNQTVTGETVSSGDQIVLDGGITSNTTIRNGGNQYLSSGGAATVTTISSGGSQYIYYSGIASSTTIGSNGAQYISGGGFARATTISAGRQYVYDGGLASSTTINGGSQTISSGGTAMVTSLNNGGNQYISNGGLASSTTIEYASQTIFSGGTAAVTTISGGGNQYISDGGLASSTAISSGRQYIYNGGLASSTAINGGSQTISSGGTAAVTTINSYGSQIISGGGLASATIIISGGGQYVYDGGSASDTTINSGSQTISSGGVATVTTISSGGSQLLSGTAVDTTINNSGRQYIYAGGLASSTTINSGGNQYISSGGSASSATVNSSGYQQVSSGGAASDTTINGGSQVVSDGGLASNTTINGGGQYISSGGLASAATINNSGRQYIYVGGVASNTTIGNGGSQILYNSGSASGTTINSGGRQYISNGATAADTTINGGIQTVSGGGTASSTTINNGSQVLLSGGISIDATALSGGTIQLSGGGILGGLTDIAGGVLSGQLAGPSASMAQINLSNGGLWTDTGDSTAGTLNIDNGTLSIRNASAETYNTFTVNNLAAGNSAVIDMNVELGDDSSQSDLLSITGSYTGNALIRVTDTGNGTGAHTTADGIKLVDMNGITTGGFDLLGGKADAGAYEYLLYKGGLDGSLNTTDYFLRTKKVLTNVFKTMTNIPELNILMAKTGMNSLEKRLGDLHDFNNTANGHGVWARTYAKELKVKDLINTNMSLFGAEAGYDWLFTPEEPNKLYAGVMAGYMQTGRVRTRQDDGQYGSGDGSAPSVGIYATLVNENGWFVDLAGRHFWTKLDMTNYDAGGTPLKYTPERNVLTASLELGKEFKVDAGQDGFVRITPKVEAMYARDGAESVGVKNGSGDLAYDTAQHVTGKAALLIGYAKKRADGLLIEPLIELSYMHEFGGKGKMTYDAVEYRSDLSGGSIEGAVGLNMQLTKDMYVYGQGTYEKGNKIDAYGGNLGIRFGFGGGKKNEDKEAK